MMLLALLLVFSPLIDGKHSQGILMSDKEFAYLDRFCYQSDTGQLEFNFTYPASYPVHSLLTYYDTTDQWLKAYTQLSSCIDRLNVLRDTNQSRNIVRLDPYDPYQSSLARCRFITDDFNHDRFVRCSGVLTFSSRRSRWWFMAVSTCDEEPANYTGINIAYNLLMTNGEPDDFFTYQFSDDQRWIMPITLGFIGVNVILLSVSWIVAYKLHERRLHHSAYRMYTHSIFLDLLGLTCICVHYFYYARNGLGIQFLNLLGTMIRCVANMFFVVMLLILSRGLNVVKMRLTILDNMVLAVLILFFLSSYVGMQVWEFKGFDPALVYYESESLPGYLLAGLNIVAWIFLLVSSYFTMTSHPNKRHFYISFALLYTPWFFSDPVVLGIANFVLDNWVREEVVFLVNNCVTTYGFLIFLYLSWPSMDNENFPFHIRTTQVDCGFDPTVNYAVKDDTEHIDAPERPQITTS